MIRRRLVAQVDEQNHARTNAPFRVAMESWLRTHEVEETTRASYEPYARKHVYPAFGDEPVGRVTARPGLPHGRQPDLHVTPQRCRPGLIVGQRGQRPAPTTSRRPLLAC